jgi:hypothetical protein
MNRKATCAGIMLLATLAGCGDGTGGPAPVVTVYQVKGKVLLPDNKPLSGGVVYFVPKDGAMTSEGSIRPDGSFSLVTGTSGEGAPPGDYKIRIEPADPSLLPNRNSHNRKKLPFPNKYLDEDSSGLLVTVKPESNVLDPITLK